MAKKANTLEDVAAAFGIPPDELSALLADQGVETAEGTWRPIASAPKDTAVLTYRGVGLMAVAENIVHPAKWGTGNQTRIWCCTDGCELLNVTHWMPLPASPVETIPADQERTQ